VNSFACSESSLSTTKVGRPFPDLAAHGIKHAYLAFEGESHGFRKAETVIASLAAELASYGEIFGFTPRTSADRTLLAGRRSALAVVPVPLRRLGHDVPGADTSSRVLVTCS
jgi:hypothetical protein